jgi:membrane-associated phospholipid phosphatase
MKRLIIFALIILPVSAQAQHGIDQTDFAFLQKLEAHRRTGMTKTMRVISDANMFVNLGVPTGLLVAGAIRHDEEMQRNGLYIVSSTATTIILTIVIKQLVKRPRPFLAHLNFTPVYRPSQHSFPSGHTSSAFSTATSLSVAYPKWYVIAPSLLWAGSVGFSRMYLGVHYPTDVGAGAALGAGTALGMQFIRK